ncbi:hypothetical protein WMF45_46785 [Sorangium sp. So ce448]|uniref:hypothetical protein n=1 Tax=Sorangium sp. So ce448 TaxID=3133314 RepID=UPI003F5D8F53
MKVKLAGRTDVGDIFWQQSGILDAKLVHTPFLVFKEVEDGIEVEIVEQASALSAYPRQTKVMVQWRGEWRSDFFQMTVGDVLDAMGSNIAGQSAEELRQATEVVLYVGPKGGFRSLSYRSSKTSMNVGIKAMADPVIAFFEKNGIPIERRVRR